MGEIKEYHLNKNLFSKIHLEVKVLEPYLKKNWEKAVRAHRHSFYQIIWFENKGRHYVDYEVIDHPENSIFFLNKGQIHYFCPNASNKGIAIHFNEQFIARFGGDTYGTVLNDLFDEIGKPYVILDNPEQANFKMLSGLLIEELNKQQNDYAIQSYFLLRTLMTLILRRRELLEYQKSAGKDYDVATQFRKLIDQHLDSRLSISFFSEKLHITEKKLSRLTKAHFNNTPAGLIKQRKILEAKRKLSNKKTSVKEIAFELGFEEPSNFTKYFKKHTGILPREFQKLLP